MESINKFTNGRVKWFLVPVLTIILIIGVSSCTEKRDIPEEMVNYMRNKYNEEFTLISKDIQSWMDSDRTMLVEPAVFPSEQVQVNRTKSGVMTDGYLALKVNADVEKEISAVAFEVYGENKVFNLAQTGANSKYSMSDISAFDFLKIKPGFTHATIFITKGSSEKEQDVEAFRQALQKKGYYLTFVLIYVEEEAFPLVNIANIGEYRLGYTRIFSKEQSMIILQGSFMIWDESFEFEIYRWEEPSDFLIKNGSE